MERNNNKTVKPLFRKSYIWLEVTGLGHKNYICFILFFFNSNSIPYVFPVIFDKKKSLAFPYLG